MADAALTWISIDAHPRVIVDGWLALLWANPEAEALFAQKCGVEIRSGLLATSDPARQEALREIIVGSQTKPVTLCLARTDGAGWLLLRAQCLGSAAPRLYGLQFALADRDHCPVYHHLDAAFGLTNAEHRVLLALLAGKDAETLAKDRGITVETARTHIRNIYAKLDVNSRERLFFKVLPFAVF